MIFLILSFYGKLWLFLDAVIKCIVESRVQCRVQSTKEALIFTFFLQIGADGRRNQVFLALSTAAEFRDHLSHFSDFYANLGELLNH